MNKCLYTLSVIAITLISDTAPEDICESCVQIPKCAFFAKLGQDEKQTWIQKYPCNDQHPDDYGSPPGTNQTGQEDFICCPNEIWRVEPAEGPSSRLTDITSRFGSPQNTPDSYYNQNPYSSQNNGGSGGGNINEANSQWVPSDRQNQTQSAVEPSRYSTNQNRYWNERPDKNRWDIGNKNFYQGNGGWGSNNRNYYDNNRRGNGNGNQGVRYPPNDNSNRFDTQERRNNIPQYPNNRQPSNSFGSGQCDRLTRLPPDPQSGCCGREASDDDRINDTPYYNDNFAPASLPMHHRKWEPPEYEDVPQYFGWPYSMFKEEINSTQTNNTIGNAFGTKFVNNSTENGTIGVSGSVDVENRISGGKETELTQYPWTVLLITTFENNFQRTAFNCGGALISSRYVLTAGHCVHDDEGTIKSIQVFLAEFDKRSFPWDCKMTGEGRKCIENVAVFAEDVVRHPRFDETRLQNDIALIKLQQDVPYTEYIRPICLPSINVDNPEHAQLSLHVAGWGRNGQYKSDIKQSTTVHLVPQHDCKKYYPDLTRRHLCAAGYTGEDTCKGDSGGPLMVLYRGRYYAVGVVSGKRTDVPCGSSVPSLYTNVYHYLDWIRENMQS